MSWKPIVVGVDASPEAARAGALGAELANAAHTPCHLIHAAVHPWTVVPSGTEPGEGASAVAALYARERGRLQHALWGHVPARTLEHLSVRLGHPAVALRQAAAEVDAELLVIGGKRHTTLGEWAGRSTAMHLIRTTEVPVLVATVGALPRRILVALDGSDATGPTLEAAVHYAALVGAQLKAVSVVEPLPTIGEVPPLDPEPYYEMSRTVIEQQVWPLLTRASFEKTIVYGPAAGSIAREAGSWGADLIVVGSHGKNWFERVFVGSVTEQLVHELPVSLLVVPVYAALAAAGEASRAAAVAV